MRISDWSSDVCSSDLGRRRHAGQPGEDGRAHSCDQADTGPRVDALGKGEMTAHWLGPAHFGNHLIDEGSRCGRALLFKVENEAEGVRIALRLHLPPFADGHGTAEAGNDGTY